MPFPIIGWAVGAAAVAVAGAVYKMWNNDEDSSNSNENKKCEYDPTILIGTQSSGKTILANWLAYNELKEDSLPTNFGIDIKEFLDYSGLHQDAQFWEDEIKKKKNVFYLFDVEKFLNKINYADNKYNKIVINQISFLTEYLKEKVTDKKIIIIGTHLDKIENKKTQEIITELKNEINLGKAKILFGSLISEEKATLLEKDIINILKEGIK